MENLDITSYMTTIVYIVSTLFTYFAGLMSKKRGYNTNIPIPVQNILIGVICFMTVYITSIVIKQPINLSIVINYLITSLGGAGTATLYYDTNKTISEEE